jgi:hypothetical protein
MVFDLAEFKRPSLQTAGQPDLTFGITGSSRRRGAAALECAAAFVSTWGLMLWIQFASPAIIGNDAYYHIRWSRMLRASLFSRGLPRLPAFPYLPLTVLRASDFVDQHFLFHAALMPFTFGDLRIGAKFAAPLFAALAMTSLFALLVVYRIRYRWLWLFPLVAGSAEFLYRMSMTRAPSLSLVILAVSVYLISERKFFWLAPLTFVFVWLYNMFPLIVAFALADAVAILLADRRIDLRAFYFTAIGVALGLLINPYPPKDVVLISHHVRMLLADTAAIDVGSEWNPFDTWELLAGNALVLVLGVFALLAFDFKKRAQDRKPLFFLLVTAGLLLMGLRWRRFVEYWPPFTVLFAALTFSSRGQPARVALTAPDQTVHPSPLDAERSEWPLHLSPRTAATVLTAIMAVIGVVNVRAARAKVRDTDDPFAMRGASAWLAAHTPAGSIVFNVDWAEFPELFYYNQRNFYVSGLDPRYLYDAQPELWKVYDSITEGTEKHPGPLIRQRFGAEYVVARADSTDFIDAAKASNDFETVYTDDFASILRVR